MNGFTRAFVFLIAIVLLLGAGAAFTGFYYVGLPLSTSEEQIVFEVRPGESFRSVARRLEERGLVRSARFLNIYARLTGMAGRVRVGEYAVRRNLRPKDILNTLSTGQSILYSITVSEGLNRFEVADIVERQNVATRDEFLALTVDRAFIREVLGRDALSLEGYLFPETYHITKYTGARGLVKVMVDRFKENFARARAVPGWSLGAMSEHELITLASIVEKETGAPEERPVISSVFHNRLKKKMALQTDPTIIYGLWVEKGEWDGKISRADLKFPSRYNTYLHKGLPPGPIANPGFEALKAAGAPAQTEFLFFVSRNNGTHVFSTEYKQHSQAVQQFQIDKKAREGKSWRDLQKRETAPAQVISAPPTKAPSVPVKNAPTAQKAAGAQNKK